MKKIAPGNAAEVLGYAFLSLISECIFILYFEFRPAFYLTFWQLSTYDLAPPAARYDEECATLRALSREEDSKYIAADRSPDRTRRRTAFTHREKRNRINSHVQLLSQEFREQTAARAFTIKRLAREKQHWFSHSRHTLSSFDNIVPYIVALEDPKATALASSFIEHCIQPRCLISPMDADFCAQILKVIHMQGTPGFSTLMCYDRVSHCGFSGI